MDDVNICIEIRIRGFRAGKGYYAYLLEYIDKRKEPRTKIGFGVVEDATKAKLTLTALIEALKRFVKPCSVWVSAEYNLFINAFKKEWVKNWKENGWKRAQGKELKHEQLWKECVGLLENHLYDIDFEKKGHDYKERLQYDLKKIETGEITVERMNELANPPSKRKPERRYEQYE